jgi:SH3-like domain-containing protein
MEERKRLTFSPSLGIRFFMWYRILFFSLFLCLDNLHAGNPVTITVVGDRVNYRNAPTIESDVIGASDYGDTLQAISFEEKWVEILPPAGTAIWVYAPLLFEEKEVRAQVLNVRAGPGTQFPILGQLNRGDKVEIEESLEDWRRIKAPESISLWISRDFIQAPPSVTNPAPTPTPVPRVVLTVPTPTPQPVRILPTPTPEPIVEIRTVERIVEVPVLPTPTPVVTAPDGLELVPLTGQGSLSVRKGVLKAYLMAGTSPSRFVLVRRDADGTEKTLSYLRGNEEDMKSLSGLPVQVRGHDFWVAGQKLPVTKVDSIESAEGARP